MSNPLPEIVTKVYSNKTYLTKEVIAELTLDQIAAMPASQKAAYRAEKKKERTIERAKLRDSKNHIIED